MNYLKASAPEYKKRYKSGNNLFEGKCPCHGREWPPRTDKIVGKHCCSRSEAPPPQMTNDDDTAWSHLVTTDHNIAQHCAGVFVTSQVQQDVLDQMCDKILDYFWRRITMQIRCGALVDQHKLIILTLETVKVVLTSSSAPQSPQCSVLAADNDDGTKSGVKYICCDFLSSMITIHCHWEWFIFNISQEDLFCISLSYTSS